LARVRLANQLLAALTPGKAARGAETGEGKGKKEKEKREKQVRTLSGAKEMKKENSKAWKEGREKSWIHSPSIC
jgi:hypothetical protein